MSEKQYEFQFRIWLHPKDGDPPEVETWHQGLDPVDTQCRPVSEWARELLFCYDFNDEFNLSDSKHWQIVGTAVISSEFDYYGEYDEEITFGDFEFTEVLQWFVDHKNRINKELSLN